jgi:plasmid stabilization system protein ParE
MKIRFELRALDELSAIVDYYLLQSVDVAARFEEEFESATRFLAENPQIAALVEGRVRRWNLNKFPYAIFYQPHPDGIVIVTIMHARRDPEAWKKNR